jgi:hypothetical protein
MRRSSVPEKPLLYLGAHAPAGLEEGDDSVGAAALAHEARQLTGRHRDRCQEEPAAVPAPYHYGRLCSALGPRRAHGRELAQRCLVRHPHCSACR